MAQPGASPVVGELLAGTLLPDGTDPVCEGPAQSTQVSAIGMLPKRHPAPIICWTHMPIPVGGFKALVI